VLGSGSFGEVWKAVVWGLNGFPEQATVAVKKLKREKLFIALVSNGKERKWLKHQIGGKSWGLLQPIASHFNQYISFTPTITSTETYFITICLLRLVFTSDVVGVGILVRVVRALMT